MAPIQVWLGLAGTVLLFIVLGGVVVRRRYREWWSFALYLSFLTAYATLVALQPERYHTPALWVVNESITGVLRFLVAVELAFRTFRGFPGAMARLRVALLAVVSATLLVVLAATPPRLTYVAFVGQVTPRVVNGSIWLFTAIAVLILWYRLPVRIFHKRILLSYVPYLLVFTVAMNALGASGWERGRLLSNLNQLAYLALMGFWAHAVWHSEPRPAEPPGAKPSPG